MARGVGCFWDLENCACPTGKRASKVANKIRSMPFYSGKSELEFLVVCDVTKESEEVINDLNAAQVSVQHVAAAKKKNAADEKLRQAMRRFVDTHTSAAAAGDAASLTLTLISGDSDFAPDLYDFKHRKGVHVVLLHNKNASEALLSAAHECMDFHSILHDVPARPPTQTPFQFTELVVNNIPSTQEMSKGDVERKLEELVRAYGGRVKYISDRDGTAVLKFENGEKAGRALKNAQGCQVGRRKVQLDFNRRVNFVSGRQKSSSPKRKPVATVVAVKADEETRIQRSEMDERPGQGASSTFDPLSVDRLRIMRDPRQSTRRVRQVSGESSTAAEASSEDQEGSPEPVTATGARRRTRIRGRRRSSRHSSDHGRSSSVDSDGRIAVDLAHLNLQDTSVEDELESAFKFVRMLVTDIETRSSKAIIEITLKAMLAENNIIVNTFQLTNVSENCYCCVVDVPDVKAGQALVNALDGMPYGNKCIKVSFQEIMQSREAKLALLLQEENEIMPFDILRSRYISKYDEEMTMDEVELMPSIKLYIPCGEVAVHATLSKKTGGEADQKRRTTRTVAICQSSALGGGSGQSPLCPLHDKRNLSETHFMLPNVIAKQSHLRQLLTTAMALHEPLGIPLESLLYCLRAVGEIQVCADGIPLEQLVEATCLTETVVKNGVALVRPRGKNYMEKMHRIVGQKTVAMGELQRQIQLVLNSEPSYRVRIVDQLRHSFTKIHGKSFEEAVCEAAGDMEVDWVIRRMPDAFLVIGQNDKAEVTASHKYLRSTFILAVRKILSHMDSEEKILSYADSESFAHLYQIQFKKPFDVKHFGVCHLDELFEILTKTEQYYLSFGKSEVSLAQPLRNFVHNALRILEDREAFSCTISYFDDTYTRNYGQYNVPSMSFKTIQGLFREFPNEFSVFDRPSVRGESILSLSDKRKIKCIQENFVVLLQRSSSGALMLDQLELGYFTLFRRSLKDDVNSLPRQTMSEVIAKFDPNANIEERHMFVILTTGTFLSNFVKKAIALLFHHPSQHMSESVFVPMFKSIFGAQAFLDLVYLSKELKCEPRPFLERKFHCGEPYFSLAQHAVTVCKLTKIAVLGSLTHDEAFESYYETFGEQLDLHGFQSLWELCESLPDFLVVSHGTLGLSDGGRYFNALMDDYRLEEVVTASADRMQRRMEMSGRPTATSSTVEKKRKPRLAANFRRPLGGSPD